MLLQGQKSLYRGMMEQANMVAVVPGSASDSQLSPNEGISPSSLGSPASTPPQSLNDYISSQGSQSSEDSGNSEATQSSRDGDSFTPSQSLKEDSPAESPESTPAESSELTSEESSSDESSPTELSESEEAEVEELKDRDQEVRQHEQAHMAAAGPYSRGMNLDYTTGPDSKRYVTSGHVDIDTSPVSGDPNATIAKAQVIQRAASAPAEPSSQDKKVESQARSMEMKAREDLREEQLEESKESTDAKDSTEGQTSSESQKGESNQATARNNPYQQNQAAYQAMASSGSLNLVA